MALVAVLVLNFHQPLDQAWRFTLREYFMIADFKGEMRKISGKEWDHDMLGAFEQQLRDMGVQV